MSRSVDYLSNAQHVAFFPYPTSSAVVFDEETEQEIELTDEYEDWDWVKEDLIGAIQQVAPSMDEPGRAKYDGRETVIILENNLAEIGVSEYCGLMSLSIRVAEDCDYPGLAEAWIEKTWPAIRRAVPYEHYEKIGTFSNGEAVYQKAQP